MRRVEVGLRLRAVVVEGEKVGVEMWVDKSIPRLHAFFFPNFSPILDKNSFLVGTYLIIKFKFYPNIYFFNFYWQNDK